MSIRILESISKFIKMNVKKYILKTEILSIYVTGGRFLRLVRVSPRRSSCQSIDRKILINSTEYTTNICVSFIKRYL